jgi:hypothetical protein
MGFVRPRARYPTRLWEPGWPGTLSVSCSESQREMSLPVTGVVASGGRRLLTKPRLLSSLDNPRLSQSGGRRRCLVGWRLEQRVTQDFWDFWGRLFCCHVKAKAKATRAKPELNAGDRCQGAQKDTTWQRIILAAENCSASC